MATKEVIQDFTQAMQKDITLLRQEVKAMRWQTIVGTGTLVVALLAVFKFLV